MAGPQRNFSDLITAFSGQPESSHLPYPFRQWAAISTIAGAMGKRSWYEIRNTTDDGIAYRITPNLFIVLMAEPGVGKSSSLSVPFSRTYEELCEPIGTPKSAWDRKWERHGLEFPLWAIQDRITAERLAIDMASCYRVIPGLSTATDLKGESSLSLVTSEFGDLMSKFDTNVQNFLTVSWDSADKYLYRTKNKGTLLIKEPCLNWIAGATPQQFVEYMPKSAQGQGLLSRIILIYYGGQAPEDDLEYEAPSDHKVGMLTEDLAAVARMEGRFTFDSDETYQVAREWVRSGGDPKPSDPKLVNYCTRRKVHLLKLAMAVSASEGDTQRITLAQWERSKRILMEAEKHMPKALTMFGVGDAGRISNSLIETLHYKRSMGKQEFLEAAINQVRNINEAGQIIANMREAGLIKLEGGRYRCV